jgi:hypothetical protein
MGPVSSAFIEYKDRQHPNTQQPVIFYRGRNWFLPQQNLSDPFYDFLDGFSRVRMVVEKNIKNVQNRLEISFLNMFLKKFCTISNNETAT